VGLIPEDFLKRRWGSVEKRWKGGGGGRPAGSGAQPVLNRKKKNVEALERKKTLISFKINTISRVAKRGGKSLSDFAKRRPSEKPVHPHCPAAGHQGRGQKKGLPRKEKGRLKAALKDTSHKKKRVLGYELQKRRKKKIQKTK